MSSNLQNSIWPNAGGTLGQIKVQMPTGTDNDTIKWPTGDALVNNFVYHKGKLVGFVDTKALIANSSKTTTLPYEYVNISLPSIAEGEMTYNHDQCIYFILNGEVIKGNISSDGELEIITKKYAGCTTVADVIAKDPNYLTNDIVNGVWSEGLGDLESGNSADPLEFRGDGGMFYWNLALTAVDTDLSSLTDGECMFRGCYNLTDFPTDMPSLTNGSGMFEWCNLTSFSSDLSSLTNGRGMFSTCSNLASFSSDLTTLENGFLMFDSCYNLTAFNSNLPSLTDGEYMFQYCKLDTSSVQKIADTINTPTTKAKIYIGIGNSTPNYEEIAAFNTIVSKNWTVYVSVNGGNNSPQWTPTSLTPIDGEEEQTPIPFWAKPINADEQHARYVDAQGNFYNILGGNFIYGDNLETYGMFTSEEDAAANMRLTKI